MIRSLLEQKITLGTKELFLGTPITDQNEGIRMKCSNQQCPFDGQPVHDQCFALYEDHLIKKIATMGMSQVF